MPTPDYRQGPRAQRAQARLNKKWKEQARMKNGPIMEKYAAGFNKPAAAEVGDAPKMRHPWRAEARRQP